MKKVKIVKVMNLQKYGNKRRTSWGVRVTTTGLTRGEGVGGTADEPVAIGGVGVGVRVEIEARRFDAAILTRLGFGVWADDGCFRTAWRPNII